MKKSLIILVLVGIVGFIIYRNNKEVIENPPQVNNTQVKSKVESPALSPPVAENLDKTQKPKKSKKPTNPYAISSDDPDPRIQSVVEARKTGKYPERLSSSILPKAFDYQAWENDNQYREKYIYTIEPARWKQLAEPSPDNQELQKTQLEKNELKTGDTLELSAIGLPHTPISFYSPNGGIFTESKFNSITVLADNSGAARVTWYAPPGTLGHAVVLAGSPYTVNNIRYTFNVNGGTK